MFVHVQVQYATTLRLTEETFKVYVDVVNTFHQVFPGSVVTNLLDPLLSELTGSFLMVNDSNLEVRYKALCFLTRPFSLLLFSLQQLYTKMHNYFTHYVALVLVPYHPHTCLWFVLANPTNVTSFI